MKKALLAAAALVALPVVAQAQTPRRASTSVRKAA